MAVESGVLVALITASVSLVLGIGNAVLAARRERLARDADRAERLEERAASARSELDRVREPLISASLDLAHRLDNIRHEHFLDAYLLSGEPRRAEIARKSTLYRFGRYWCMVETLYDRVALLHFRHEEATSQVDAALRDIGRTLASDRYDAGRFMVWREEQRAIAEKMRDDGTPLGCVGFASFVEHFDDDFAPWFATFNRDLEAEAAVRSQRFQVLQLKLAELARQLDSERNYESQWRRLMDNAQPST